MKPYIIISGLNINDNNRGTAALSYGSISFLHEKEKLDKKTKIIKFRYVKNILKKRNRGIQTLTIKGNDCSYQLLVINIFFLEKVLFNLFNIILPFTKFGKTLKNIEYVAAINGGDGFSDIYNTQTFKGHIEETLMAIRLKIPVIILPQTLGPFSSKRNLLIAEKILKYASKIYVRDNKFISELIRMNLPFEETKDLSYYMQPLPFNIDIKPNSVGINVSGLTYSNQFRTLAGQFPNYPYLIIKLIELFQKNNTPIYLIPHSYNYKKEVENNDDLVACKKVYNTLTNTTNVFLLDQDLTSPQVKYIISKMSFFIGTRMHANFAAIYTGVPLFGLAYSYKFQGAFEANGIYNSTALINNISKTECDTIISTIYAKFLESKNKREQQKCYKTKNSRTITFLHKNF